MAKQVLVALSGGLDSAMTVVLLQQLGYEVQGVHFQLFRDLSQEIKERLQKISKLLSVEIEYFDARKLFADEVTSYLIQFHSEGKTPSLCTRCNPKVKWKILEELVNCKGYSNFATGHYVRIVKEKGVFRIFRGVDPKKDQSYYLWGLKQNFLSRGLCPLGDYSKNQVKEMAARYGLGFLVKKKESVGLCFAKGKNYIELLQEYSSPSHPGRSAGKIVNSRGVEIGKHKGYLYYTIGQKKELLFHTNEKLCVSHIHAETNTLTADRWQNLYSSCFELEQFYFPVQDELYKENQINTMVRGFGLNPEGNTCFELLENGNIMVSLDKPAWAIAKGQPAVFYSGEKQIGGGLIL